MVRPMVCRGSDVVVFGPPLRHRPWVARRIRRSLLVRRHLFLTGIVLVETLPNCDVRK